ncbi:MAG: hypothetical protein ACK5SI_03375 [Planctomycetia bacterium]|jgi:hypothetical protein
MNRCLIWMLLAVTASVAIAGDSQAPEGMKPLQGQWRLAAEDSGFHSAPSDVVKALGATPESIADRITTIRVEGPALFIGDGTKPIRLGHNRDLQDKYLRPVAEGATLLIMTFENGTVFTSSYSINGDTLVLRWPHTCNCGRSGMITTYRRMK